MLVAEKYKYLEELEPYIEQPLVHKTRPPVHKVQPIPARNTASKVVSVLMVMICFATACLVVARYSQISENHNQIMALNKSLDTEYSNQEKLKVELAFMEDLNHIETAAKVSLGMDHPGEDQVVYVKLPDTKSEPIETKVAQSTSRSLWSRLLGFAE